MSSHEIRSSSPAILGPFAVWEGAIGQEDLKFIEQYGDGLSHQGDAPHQNHARYDQTVRVTKAGWIGREPKTEAFHARMENIILGLNSQFFQFDLTTMTPIQYAVCDGSEQGDCAWHSDHGRDPGPAPPLFRKLSIHIQLSDPAQYQGGELQARVRSRIDVAPKTRGTVIAFPSFVLHRVTQVTAGTRKSLAVWLLGPDYR